MQLAKRVVIVGGVAGGAACASRIRRLNESMQITMFEKGPYISYANCGLPYYIGGVIQKKSSLLLMTPEAFKSRYNVDVKINHEVTAIDKVAKQITVFNQINNEMLKVCYDKLVLAVGSNPILPPTPGIKNPRIFTLRTIHDSQTILDFCIQKQAKRAVIVGGGFIGLEMAESLHHRGIKVTIIEKYHHIMKIIDQEMAALLHQHLKLKGIELILGNSVVQFQEAPNGVDAILENGRKLETDFVIFSIGVLPDLALAKSAGLKTGKGICTNTQMYTSDPDIFAVGDAAEVTDLVGGSQCCIPLAGPAAKQARVVADIICGRDSKYEGSIGTGVAKVFDLSVACVGNNESLLKMQKIPYQQCIVHGMSHAGYYPQSYPISIKLLFQKNGKILGGQVIGADGVDKRNDVLATAIRFGLTVQDLQKMELSYAPPFGSVKDPVNAAGFVASNLLKGDYQSINWNELETYQKNGALILDVREKEEYKKGAIPGSTLMCLSQIRESLHKLPKDKDIIILCKTGLRGYLAQRILFLNGFTKVFNLSGGFKTWVSAVMKQSNPKVLEDSFAPTLKQYQDNMYETLQSEFVNWDPDFEEYIPKM